MIGQWGLMRRLHRGTKLMLFLNYKCNLNCDYCSLGYIGKRVESETIELDDWKYLVESFPLKLREIRISGGEPMLMPYYAELINWLLDRGFYVMVFTNLTVLNFDVKPNSRLIYSATYHKGAKYWIWKKHLEFYRKRYKVNAQQLEDETISGIKVSPVCDVEYGYTCVGFMYNPAGKLFTGFIKMLEGSC